MKLPENATLADAPALLVQLNQALDGGSGPLEIDAGALQNFDTSAIALLMQARRLAHTAGRSFSVLQAPPKLAELARLYGVEELLSLAPSAPESRSGTAA